MHLGILGGGPVGLEMAVAAVRSGRRVTLIERGPELCWNLRSWGHVELFSPASMNMSSLGKEILRETSTDIPGDQEFLTGTEYEEKYLRHLKNFLSQVRY